MDEIDKDTLASIGFKPLGSDWFGNEGDTIRVRLWRGEIDVWNWWGVEHKNEIVFRGKLKNIDELKFILKACFNG